MLATRTLVLLIASTSLATAETGELTERSPSTLEPAEVRVGLFDAGIGLWGHKLLERIELSTRPMLWSAWAFGAPTYDVRAKFEFWREDNLSLSAGFARMHVNFQPLLGEAEGDPGMVVDSLVFDITPVEGWAAYRFTDLTRVTAGVVYTAVSLGAGTSPGPIDELGGAVGTSNLEVHATVQHRISRSWTLIGGGRVLGYQKQWAEARVAEMVGPEDEGEVSNTTRVEGDALKMGRAFTVDLAAHFARKHFNLRFGVELGNYHVPFVNFVLPSRGVMPTFDVYWRL